MFDKLEELERKYNELSEKISDPNIISDQETWQKIVKEQTNMKDVVEKYVEYKNIKKNVIYNFKQKKLVGKWKNEIEFSIFLLIFYNNIGLICSPSKAYSVVFIKYSGSNTIDLGFVIGLSCLNGTK